jgi:hypothetical protein
MGAGHEHHFQTHRIDPLIDQRLYRWRAAQRHIWGPIMNTIFRHTALTLSLITGCTFGGPSSDTLDTGNSTLTYDDADGDSIIDSHDGTDDVDGDGHANWLDQDSDGDSIPDQLEAGDNEPFTFPVDSDGDSTPDFLDLDADNNCIDDKTEAAFDGGVIADTDADGVSDHADPDNDGDGISDLIEIGMDCSIPDSDGDTIPDYIDIDSDGDGIGDIWEAGTSDWQTEPRDTDGDGSPDYLDLDSDNDGIKDSVESGITNPEEEPRDTDGDGDYDFADSDADGDAISDWDETNIHGTDPYDADSDGDGFSDGGEVIAGSDPTDADSGIYGIYIEVGERSSSETHFEFNPRIQMGDVAFLLDTTCSMSATANAMAEEFSAIVNEVTGLIPDTQTGFATYDDYAYGSFGNPARGDKPFILHQQITDQLGVVQAALGGVSIHSGVDSPESTMEALFQGVVGGGYDQNCNGIYDASTDVKPFLSDPEDPFDGSAGQAFDSSTTGGGIIGGYGFREHALPIVVYATDNYLRDPEAGYATPGGCPMDAGHSDVVEAFAELGGYAIGINTRSHGTSGIAQMEAIAEETGSIADTDGDGLKNDLLVFTWTGSSDEFRDTVTSAIEDLVGSIQFSTISLQVEGDDWGFVTSIEPAAYTNVTSSSEIDALDFSLSFRGVVAATSEDQLFTLKLNVVGDDTILLDSLDLIVVVPGNTY